MRGQVAKPVNVNASSYLRRLAITDPGATAGFSVATNHRSPLIRSPLRSGRARDCGTVQLGDVRNKRRFLAAGTMAVKAAIGADDRFGTTFADDKRMAASPTGLGIAVGEIGGELFHGRLR
jgi:hypothetical protein